ncbi:MAG: hypothetical protein ABIO70_30900 [Pseudomonadota bacterium]
MITFPLLLLAGCALWSHDMNPDTPTMACARSQDLELCVQADGALLSFALANRGSQPLTVQGAVEGPNGRHWDVLRVEIAALARTLRFTGDRNSSTIGQVVLASGQSVEDTLDLAAWAREPINGATPLPHEPLEIHAIYSLSRPGLWNGELDCGPVLLQVPVLDVQL